VHVRVPPEQDPRRAEAEVTIDEAIAVMKAMDMSEGNLEPFSETEREAIVTLGAAGWAADLAEDDPRIAELPFVIELVQVMATKRVQH